MSVGLKPGTYHTAAGSVVRITGSRVEIDFDGQAEGACDHDVSVDVVVVSGWLEWSCTVCDKIGSAKLFAGKFLTDAEALMFILRAREAGKEREHRDRTRRTFNRFARKWGFVAAPSSDELKRRLAELEDAQTMAVGLDTLTQRVAEAEAARKAGGK